MKKQSVRQQVLNFANKHPDGFTAADVRKAIKADPKRLYVVLWQMKKSGELKHNDSTHIYSLSSLTGVNKKPVVVKPEPPSTKPDYEIMLKKADESYADLAARLQDERQRRTKTEERYNDALAIVRYLEDKLFKAIQYDVRRGSNT